MENSEKMQKMRHSLAHIMAAAIRRLYPEAKFGVGPAIDDGFYYDIDLGEDKISELNFNKKENGSGLSLSLKILFIASYL